ncbi:toprim domain-containing protein [Streptomyces sp. 15-116A]|uniref:toprim domain-containing protein n=1 Tax=Streptomyces sp. 15-116A TaxID=2259035 RepID=UPI0021B37098|nr:toprim domain-containing protein [Streptomyces sp. 15-116A]MCT7353619.1 toprim domain-containing protein [Streptomyces sp. 15-116A]
MRARDRVLDALSSRGCSVRGKSAQCPAHEDRSPSLSIGRRKDGNGVVLNCHAGCAPEDVVAALGLTMQDLFDEPLEKRERPQVVAQYPYVDEHGQLLLTVKRLEPGYDGQRKTFRQYAPDGKPKVSGIRRVLYRLPEVLATAKAGGTVFIVEGEKDADNLAAQGACATTSIGGAGKWNDAYTTALRGAGEVIIIRDRDDPGRRHAEQVAASVRAAGIAVRILEPAKGKDISDHLAAGLGFDDLLPYDEHQDDFEQTPEGDADAPAEPEDRLPSAFWNATPALRQIRQMAHARRASPDAVLHAVLARTAAMADPTVRVDNGIHQPSTLGWYCGLFGPPGSGKGNAENTAEELTPFPNIDLAYIDISTGQGLISAYLDLKIEPDGDGGKKKTLVQARTRGYALATEGSVLDAMAQMSAAATLNGVLCKAWMSERQGTSNAEVERRRVLPKGAYVLSMSLGVQEEPAAKLLEMGSIGLPQRLAWAHATLGPDTPKERPATTGPLSVTTRDGQDVPVTHWVAYLRNTTIPVPAEVTQELDELALDISFGRGSDSPLDTHEPLWRLKCAALLTLLHGRTSIAAEDWDRAALMWRVSTKVRDRVQAAAQRRLQAELDARRAEAVLTAVESQAAVYEVVHGVHPSVVNVAKRAYRYLTRKGGEIPARDVNRACVAKTDREKYRASGATDPLWPTALQYGCEQGWLVLLEDGALITAGSAAPE